MRRCTAALSLIALLAGCAAVREPAAPGGRDQRMVQPASVAGVAEEAFGKPSWGRQGEFSLTGQRVRYERGADRIALFESLPAGVATPLRFNATIVPKSSSAARGLRPAVGSSSSSRSGAFISAIAMARIWRWPPLSVRFSQCSDKPTHMPSSCIDWPACNVPRR